MEIKEINILKIHIQELEKQNNFLKQELEEKQKYILELERFISSQRHMD